MRYIKLAIIALTKRLLVKITMLNSFTYPASFITTRKTVLFLFLFANEERFRSYIACLELEMQKIKIPGAEFKFSLLYNFN